MRPKLRVPQPLLPAVLFRLALVAIPGAGLATAAVTSVTVTPATTTLIHGQSVQLTATVNGSPTPSPAVIWSFSPTIGTLTATGLYTAPNSIFQNYSITVTATSLQDPTKSGTATIRLVPTVGISISPTSVTLNDGQSQQFTANVSGTANTAVTWAITPQTAGFITADGLYTAPAVISGKLTVSVTVVSVADPTQAANATVNLVPVGPPPGVTVNPATADLRPGQSQQFSASVTGMTNTLVVWSINPAIGTISATGLYTAPATFNANATITVTATSQADPTRFGSATITLTPFPIVVTPASVTLTTNQTQQFSATVNNAPFTDVTWSLSAPFGTIDQTGLYKAPALASTKITIQVIATANADPTHTGAATVVITQSSASITPSTISLTSGATQQFTFNIDGVADPDPANDVRWTLSPTTGTISATGLYTAPSVISTASTVTLTGTLLLDPTKTAKATISLTVFTDVGHGAPSAFLTQQFITAYNRNNFYVLAPYPIADVRRLGTTGLVQEFQDANKTSGVKYALVMPNTTGTVPPVYQMYPDVYAYYTSLGVTTVGYPTMDTQSCPSFDPNNSCTWQLFDKPYAIFSYKVALFTGTNFFIRNLFYTKWSGLGGITGPGRPVDTEVAVTAALVSGTTATTATVQTYANGAIYQITNGPNNGKVFAVLGAAYTQYQSSGGPTGFLGMPTADEIILADGTHRQTFQGGAIQYDPTSTNPPQTRLPVASVTLGAIANSGPVKMNLGDTLTLTAQPLTSTGAVLSDRPVSWSTSNGLVATVTGSGATATVKAVGAGTAYIRASSEGIVSPPLSIIVTAPCCQVGEGAPTIAMQQAFQNAVTRNHLTVALPAQNPVQRSGTGYIQQLQSTGTPPVTYLLAKSDKSPTVYIVTGDILTRYRQLGGPSGTLGYPASDASAGGTQTFENTAALGGSPVKLVSGLIFTKWTVLGLETGAAGPPVADASTFQSFGGNAGPAQQFRNGWIFGATSGPRTGQAYFVSGLILDRYTALGGPAGAYGMPLSDEFVSGNQHQQNFEGGYITYATGDAAAQEHAASRGPAVTVVPGSVLAGSRVRLAVTGFQPNATVRVSVTGQPDFVVPVQNGAYSWDVYIPLTAKAATVNIHAADTQGTDTADGSYNILSLANNRAKFTKTQGDMQTGMPGARLAQTLRAVLRDSSNNPVIGASVVFQASPGAQVVTATRMTDQNGQAEAAVRLPLAEGVALVTVDSPGIASSPVTFSVNAVSSSLPGFPKLLQSLSTPLGNGTATIAQKGALLTAVASILRYHQNRGELLTINGVADPATLNNFLKSFCGVDAKGKQICDGFLVNPDSGEQVVNLWRAGEFVTGGVDVSIENPDAGAVRDLVAQGSPVLLALALTQDGVPTGGHYVVGIGVAPDGGILIQDPSPDFARLELDDYLAGFSAGSHVWQGQLRSAIRLLPRVPLATRFLLAAVSQSPAVLQNLTMQAASVAGSCGPLADLPDAADFNAAPPASPPLVSRFLACDGSQPLYQLNLGASQPYRLTLTDFANGGTVTDLSGNSPVAYKASRPAVTLVLAPQDLGLLPNGIVDAATFTGPIATGGLFSIFGSGLAGPAGGTTVQVNGENAIIVASTPFQVNAQVPADLPAGNYSVQVTSPFGTAQQQVAVQAVAPVIFLLSGPGRGAVVNQDGTINSPTLALPRGQVLVIYCTGLGAVTSQGNLSVVSEPVTAVLAGMELPVAFAGLTPGFVGLYQVNLPVPAATPPGIDLPLVIRQAGVDSNSIYVSLQ